MKYFYVYDSAAIGKIYIAQSGAFITDVAFKPIEGAQENKTPLIDRAIGQLDEYFSGSRKEFDLPVKLTGTEFQKKAWVTLLDIPYGETRTYKEQAQAVGNIKACRAVGAANGKNPISIIFPCHRVIGANKKLTGYGGGIFIKKALLELESGGTIF